MAQLSNVVALVNPKSGERASASFLTEELLRLLPGRVVDLSKCFGDPTPAVQMIERYATGPDAIVVVAGGDGTVSFGMDIVDMVDWSKHGGRENVPFISVIPMGTGNDLSRALGFGPGFSHNPCCACCVCCAMKNIDKTVQHTVHGNRGVMDRWQITVTAPSAAAPIEQRVMNNYFSVGFDAKIAKQFDTFRKDHPGLCKTRLMNKIWYSALGTRAMCGTPHLNAHTTLTVDGNVMELPKGIKSLVVSNVDSFAGGVVLWKDKKKRFAPVDTDDGLLEVQAMYGSFHMGMMQVKMRSAQKIAQGKHVQITLTQPKQFLQWDGEAMDRVQEPCTIVITRHSCPRVLHYRKK